MMSIYDALSRLRGSLGSANRGASYGAPLGMGPNGAMPPAAAPASASPLGLENAGRQFMQKRLDELLNSGTIATLEAEAARARDIAQLRQALAKKSGDPLPAGAIGTYTGPAIGAPPTHPFLQRLPQAPAYNASPSAPSTWAGGSPLERAVQPSNPWGLPATGPGSWGYMTSAPSSGPQAPTPVAKPAAAPKPVSGGIFGANAAQRRIKGFA